MTDMHNNYRVADALERIADALEMQAAADPLTVLSQVMGDDVPSGEPQAPYASNGQTVMYQHPAGPDSGYDIVARKDRTADGGYVVSVERR